MAIGVPTDLPSIAFRRRGEGTRPNVCVIRRRGCARRETSSLVKTKDASRPAPPPLVFSTASGDLRRSGRGAHAPGVFTPHAFRRSGPDRNRTPPVCFTSGRFFPEREGRRRRHDARPVRNAGPLNSMERHACRDPDQQGTVSAHRLSMSGLRRRIRATGRGADKFLRICYCESRRQPAFGLKQGFTLASSANPPQPLQPKGMMCNVLCNMGEID